MQSYEWGKRKTDKQFWKLMCFSVMILRVSLGKRFEKTQNKTSWISPNQERLRQEGLCRYLGRRWGERGKLWKIRRPSLTLQNLTWGQKAKSWARPLSLLGRGGESCWRSVGKAEEGNIESRLHTSLRIHLEGVWKKGFLYWEGDEERPQARGSEPYRTPLNQAGGGVAKIRLPGTVAYWGRKAPPSLPPSELLGKRSKVQENTHYPDSKLKL